jgi:hypothetical protein
MDPTNRSEKEMEPALELWRLVPGTYERAIIETTYGENGNPFAAC